jgi:predicted phosphodiesterase
VEDFVTRRQLLKRGAVGLGSMVVPLWLPLGPTSTKSLKIAVIADLHHGLAPDAMERFEVFAGEVRKRKGLSLAVQMGDFCYSQPDSAPCIELWNSLKLPRLSVLGNHDMDKCDKDAAMKYSGMNSRFGAYSHGGYLFVVLDLNHFKKDGKLVPYANGNYFTDNATHNWADQDQLDWLAATLRKSNRPVILLSHQPLGFASPGQSLPDEQTEVLKVVTDAARDNPKGAVAVCLSGHMHVDRLESHEGIPCLCVNSASYFWSGGMNPYTKPLYAFLEFTPEGTLIVEGVSGAFVKPPPANSDGVVGRSASISGRNIVMRRKQ